MDLKLYPKDWDQIARAVKDAAAWQCQSCGRSCRKPNEPLTVFYDRLGVVKLEKPKQFVLTVAHLDHCPSNCAPDNLMALCTVCHLRYDARQIMLKKRLKRERLGQLNLFN